MGLRGYSETYVTSCELPTAQHLRRAQATDKTYIEKRVMFMKLAQCVGKGNVCPVHTMKAYRGNRVIDPRILKSGT